MVPIHRCLYWLDAYCEWSHPMISLGIKILVLNIFISISKLSKAFFNHAAYDWLVSQFKNSHFPLPLYQAC